MLEAVQQRERDQGRREAAAHLSQPREAESCPGDRQPGQRHRPAAVACPNRRPASDQRSRRGRRGRRIARRMGGEGQGTRAKESRSSSPPHTVVCANKLASQICSSESCWLPLVAVAVLRTTITVVFGSEEQLLDADLPPGCMQPHAEVRVCTIHTSGTSEPVSI